MRFPIPAIKPIAEFRQVMTKMFGTDAVINSTDIALDIGNQGMDPGQEFNRISPRTGNHGLVLALSRIENTISRPTIGTYDPVF